jgi:hypothetical protein
LDEQCEDFSWPNTKLFIITNFISKDLKEDNRRKLEGLMQAPSESLVSYTRRFKRQVFKAYGSRKLNADIDRIVMRLYVKSIYDKNIITRMFGSTAAPKSFNESIELAEKFILVWIN